MTKAWHKRFLRNDKKRGTKDSFGMTNQYKRFLQNDKKRRTKHDTKDSFEMTSAVQKIPSFFLAHEKVRRSHLTAKTKQGESLFDLALLLDHKHLEEQHDNSMPHKTSCHHVQYEKSHFFQEHPWDLWLP
jgi:hypothetical protein